MSLIEDANPKALRDLLDEINSRTMALADFQRDFVWEPGATQELIVSIANNYSAGSILRVRDGKGVVPAREFQGAPALDGKMPTFLVIDGQERLTSLYQAFFGVGEHRYYLDLKKLSDGADFEEAISHERSMTKRAKARDSFGYQAKELILPISVLNGGSASFLSWSIRITSSLPLDERVRMVARLAEINRQWISTIADYHFPVVTLSDRTTTDELHTIFQTVSRTGVKLSTIDLLTAQSWPRNHQERVSR